MKDLARRLNFFSTTFTSILGFSLAAEIMQEDDFEDKIDDVILLIIGIAAIWWYKTRGYKADNTVGSIVIVGLGLLTKFGALIIEHADKEALGDDIGIFIALLLAFIFIIWQTFAHKSN